VSQARMYDRLVSKTPEAAFLHVLEEEFRFSPIVSRELFAPAKEMLVGAVPAEALRPGQVRQVVARLDAPFGPDLTETSKIEVTLTLDAGAEDAEVRDRLGRSLFRQEANLWFIRCPARQ
jgi:hypothetical protein